MAPPAQKEVIGIEARPPDDSRKPPPEIVQARQRLINYFENPDNIFFRGAKAETRFNSLLQNITTWGALVIGADTQSFARDLTKFLKGLYGDETVGLIKHNLSDSQNIGDKLRGFSQLCIIIRLTNPERITHVSQIPAFWDKLRTWREQNPQPSITVVAEYEHLSDPSQQPMYPGRFELNRQHHLDWVSDLTDEHPPVVWALEVARWAEQTFAGRPEILKMVSTQRFLDALVSQNSGGQRSGEFYRTQVRGVLVDAFRAMCGTQSLVQYEQTQAPTSNVNTLLLKLSSADLQQIRRFAELVVPIGLLEIPLHDLPKTQKAFYTMLTELLGESQEVTQRALQRYENALSHEFTKEVSVAFPRGSDSVTFIQDVSDGETENVMKLNQEQTRLIDQAVQLLSVEFILRSWGLLPYGRIEAEAITDNLKTMLNNIPLQGNQLANLKIGLAKYIVDKLYRLPVVENYYQQQQAAPELVHYQKVVTEVLALWFEHGVDTQFISYSGSEQLPVFRPVQKINFHVDGLGDVPVSFYPQDIQYAAVPRPDSTTPYWARYAHLQPDRRVILIGRIGIPLTDQSDQLVVFPLLLLNELVFPELKLDHGVMTKVKLPAQVPIYPPPKIPFLEQLLPPRKKK